MEIIDGKLESFFLRIFTFPSIQIFLFLFWKNFGRMNPYSSSRCCSLATSSWFRNWFHMRFRRNKCNSSTMRSIGIFMFTPPRDTVSITWPITKYHVIQPRWLIFYKFYNFIFLSKIVILLRIYIWNLKKELWDLTKRCLTWRAQTHKIKFHWHSIRQLYIMHFKKLTPDLYYKIIT